MRNYKKHLIILGTPIKDALIKFNELASDAILFVVDNNRSLIGSVTDGDVRRGLIKGFTVENKIDEVLNRSPEIFRKDDFDIDRLIELRENQFTIVPVVDFENRVVDLINFREKKSYLPLDVVIMAGGRGQRLLPLTESIPKPLLCVGEKPIIEHNIDRLAKYGVRDFWISINYLGDQIESYLNNGHEKDISIKYIRENMPMGTIGAISLVSDFMHEYILVTNSDILTTINYEKFFTDFLRQNADMSIVGIPYDVSIPYAVLDTDGREVKSFTEKPTYTYYSNGGVYLIRKCLLDYIPDKEFYNATDLISKLIQLKFKVVSYPLTEYWLDIGNHNDYSKAKSDINNLNLE